jgi:hypothetical protein
MNRNFKALQDKLSKQEQEKIKAPEVRMTEVQASA